ncbi:MAG: AraC family transcriptional regulator [Dictyoglomaceae bacterium]|nr:AraC family transcriptional regulator [Dictyoglomaceae bacterium]
MNKDKKQLRELLPHGEPDFPFFVHENIFIYNNGVFNPHWHNEFEILYLEKGRAKFYIDGKEFILADNQFLFVNCGSIHSGEELEKTMAYAIVFDLRLLCSEEPDSCKHKFFVPLRDGKFLVPSFINDEILQRNVYKIIEIFKVKPYGYELLIKALLYEIFWEIFNRYITKSSFSGELISKLEKIKDVLIYIDINYQKPITLEELSEKANISKFYLCRIFKDLLHMSPIEYINKVRVEKATEFLRNTDMSISDIAFECGFNNISYFIKVFKTYMKITPLKYRKGLSFEENINN